MSENNPAGAEAAEEEEKHATRPQEEISGAAQTSDSKKLENGAAEQQRDVLVESLQTPSPAAHAQQEDSRIDTPRDVALEKQTLGTDSKSSQSNGGGANVNQKENTAPDN